MDIGDTRSFHLANDLAEVLCRRHIWHSEAYDITACRREFADLLNGRLRIRRLRITHGLHGDRRIAPDGDVSDVNLPRATAFEC